MSTEGDFLVVGAVLFALGALGFLTRRNLILMMLSAELMLHGVSLNLVAFSARHGSYEGQAFTAFVLTVAGCEAGISLALILSLYRRRRTLDVNVWSGLGESMEPPGANVEAAPPSPAATERLEMPRLTPAGSAPVELVDRPVKRKEPVGRA